MTQHTQPLRAFTLIEMAIVLIIIGLLLGGILAGQSLLKQSEMQTVLTDYNKYLQAVTSFRAQYGSYPGDLQDATSYWGDDSSVCSDAAVDNGSPGTCNGNSDGDMSTIAAVGAGTCKLSDGATNASCDEPYRAWQQLVLANYIEGSFTGVSQGSAPLALPGTNVPKSRVSGAGWSFWYKATTSGDANLYDVRLDNYLAFGATTTANLGTMTTFTRGAVLTPSDAYQIDRKIDDGKPGNGRVVTLKPAAMANCASNPDASDIDDTNDTYSLSTTSRTCALLMSLYPRR